MKTLEDFIKEGKTLAEAQVALAAQAASSFTGYNFFDAIRNDIPVRADFPAKDKPYIYYVVGIKSAEIKQSAKGTDWAPVECILAGGGTVTLFGSDLVKAEAKIGMTLQDAGCVSIQRDTNGVMHYAKAIPPTK